MSGSLQLASGGRKRLRLTTESYAVAPMGRAACEKPVPLESEIMVREHKRLGKNRSFAILLDGESVRCCCETGLMSRTKGYSFEGGVPPGL